MLHHSLLKRERAIWAVVGSWVKNSSYPLIENKRSHYSESDREFRGYYSEADLGICHPRTINNNCFWRNLIFSVDSNSAKTKKTKSNPIPRLKTIGLMLFARAFAQLPNDRVLLQISVFKFEIG